MIHFTIHSLLLKILNTGECVSRQMLAYTAGGTIKTTMCINSIKTSLIQWFFIHHPMKNWSSGDNRTLEMSCTQRCLSNFNNKRKNLHYVSEVDTRLDIYSIYKSIKNTKRRYIFKEYLSWIGGLITIFLFLPNLQISWN